MAQATAWVPLLQVDRDLRGRLSGATVAAAEHVAIAPAEWLDAGEWRPDAPSDEDRPSHLGLLVIDGFLARRVRVLDRPATELLGPGDLLLPWEPDRTEPLSAGARWPRPAGGGGGGGGGGGRRGPARPPAPVAYPPPSRALAGHHRRAPR